MDENDHPRGALLFMLVYLVLLAALWTNAYMLRLATTTPLTTPGFRVW